jgi:hypothetical protein
MRSLAATALTLAFIVMAAITYLAVTGDPMGGEPRLVVKIAPLDPAKFQSSAAPAPAVKSTPVASAAQPEVAASAAAATAARSIPPAAGQFAASVAGTSAAEAGTSDAGTGADAPGIGVTIPQ